MKKVLGAALIGSLALGALTADPKFTLNYRTRAQAFNLSVVDSDKSGKTTTKNWLDQDGYGNPEDSLGIKIDNDNYGTQIQFNASGINGNSVGIATLNTYNAWMKFEDAGLTLRAGSWKDGYADGNYRVKNLIDAASLEGEDGEGCKLGGVFKNTNITFIDNMAYFKGDGAGNLAFFAEYGLDLDESMTLNFLLGAVTAPKSLVKDTVKDGTDTDVTEIHSGPVARIQFKMQDTLNAQVIWKNASVKNHAVGVYVMPNFNGLAGIPLTLNVGGAMGFTAGGAKDDGANYKQDMKMESWEIDLRALYKVNDQLSIHTMNGLANYVYKGDKEYNAGAEMTRNYVKWGGKPDVKVLKMALWDMIGARYVVNDSLAVGGNAEFLIPLALAESEKGVDMAESYGMMWRVTPYVQVYAAKNAFVNIGFSFASTTQEIDKGDKKSYMEFSIPVVLRVKC